MKSTSKFLKTTLLLALMSSTVMSAHAQLFGAPAPGAAPAAPAAQAVVKAAPAPVAAAPTPAPAPAVTKAAKKAAAKTESVVKAKPATVVPVVPVVSQGLAVTRYLKTVTQVMQDTAKTFKRVPMMAGGESPEVAKSRAAGVRDLALLDAIDKAGLAAGVSRMTEISVLTRQGLFAGQGYPLAVTHSMPIPRAVMTHEPSLVAGAVKAFVDLAVARGEQVRLNVTVPADFDSELAGRLTDGMKTALAESGVSMDVTSSQGPVLALQWVGSVPASWTSAPAPQPVFATVTEVRNVEVAAKVDPVAQVVSGIVGGIFGALAGKPVSNGAAQPVIVPGVKVFFQNDAGERGTVVQEADGSKYQAGDRVAVMSLGGKAHAIALN